MAAPALADHFESYEHQREASVLGMWVFLAAEMVLFGGLIVFTQGSVVAPFIYTLF